MKKMTEDYVGFLLMALFFAIYLPKSVQFGGLHIGRRAEPIYNIPLRNLATFF